MEPESVYGVDFSGAKEAGKKIWIAEVDCTGDSGPQLIRCDPASERYETTARDATLRELTEDIAGLNQGSVAGLDFPFALPQPIVGVDDWETFLLEFPGAFVSPSEFRRRCQARGARLNEDRVEYKRETEKEHDGLSAYNYMLYKQTFYGIRDVLRPLVLSDSIRVPPMQTIGDDQPIVLETYPAGVLGEMDGDESSRENYKKDTDESREIREKNLDALKDETELVIDNNDGLRDCLLDDSEGDALDAVIAAAGAFRAAEDDFAYDEDRYDEREGYIYV